MMTPSALTSADLTIKSDAWIAGAWEDFCKFLDQPDQEKTKGYYFKGHMRLEMPPVSFDHSDGDGLVSYTINLLGTLNSVSLRLLSNCTYRKAGLVSCQPDISIYVGDQVNVIPKGTGIIDLDVFPSPSLVIEISKTSLLDDLGSKRALYESLGVSEYWIVDVQTLEVFAYKIVDQGSWGITASELLPGLSIELLAEALRRNQGTDQSQVGAWLLEKFRSNPSHGD